MIDAASTPPPEAAAGLAPWITVAITAAVGILTAAFGAVWARWRAADARLLGNLEAQVTARDVTIKSLCDKLDARELAHKDAIAALESKREEEHDKMVRTLLAVRDEMPPSAHHGLRQYEEEAPTMVRRRLGLLTRSERPEPFPGGPPRGRLPSRPR